MIEIKEQHGSEPSITRSGEVGAGDTDRRLPVPHKNTSIAHLVSTTILSLGAAVSLVMFIYLCFRFPDAGNILIPILAKPLFDYLLEQWRDRKSREEDDDVQLPPQH